MWLFWLIVSIVIVGLGTLFFLYNPELLGHKFARWLKEE